MKQQKKQQNPLIAELYEMEKEEAVTKFEAVPCNFPLSADHKYLLDSLAARFGVAMSHIARPLLEKAVEDCFLSLTPQDQDKVAEVADKKALEHLQKQAKEAGGNYERHGLGTWAAFAYVAQGKGEAA